MGNELLCPGMIHFALDDLFGQLTKKAVERLYYCLSPVSPVQSSERTMCFGKACGNEGIEYLVRMQGSQ